MELLDYPLGERRPELVTTPAGTPLAEVTLEGLRSGRVSPDELRATPETLLRQAAVARAAGREQLAENLERAAELASLPEDEVLASTPPCGRGARPRPSSRRSRSISPTSQRRAARRSCARPRSSWPSAAC